MLRELRSFWKSYRFRFTPWQAFNFNRLAVPMEKQVQSLEICDELLVQELQRLLRHFRSPDYVWMFRHSAERQREFQLCLFTNQRQERLELVEIRVFDRKKDLNFKITRNVKFFFQRWLKKATTSSCSSGTTTTPS